METEKDGKKRSIIVLYDVSKVRYKNPWVHKLLLFCILFNISNILYISHIYFTTKNRITRQFVVSVKCSEFKAKSPELMCWKV